MIVGRGLVANGFKTYVNDDRFLVFASGVSNSANTDAGEFARECSLLKSMMDAHREKTFIYFGTCSVYDLSLQHSPYVQHKLAMENLLRAEHGRYHIFRVSNLAGKTDNPHTVLNYFYQHIINGDFFQLWKNASRNIIDIDDAVTVCTHIMEENLFMNQVINIANPENYPVVKIVEFIESFTGKKGHYTLVDKGSNPVIDTSTIRPLFPLLNTRFDAGYLNRVLEKYYSGK